MSSLRFPITVHIECTPVNTLVPLFGIIFVFILDRNCQPVTTRALFEFSSSSISLVDHFGCELGSLRTPLASLVVGLPGCELGSPRTSLIPLVVGLPGCELGSLKTGSRSFGCELGSLKIGSRSLGGSLTPLFPCIHGFTTCSTPAPVVSREKCFTQCRFVAILGLSTGHNVDKGRETLRRDKPTGWPAPQFGHGGERT